MRRPHENSFGVGHCSPLVIVAYSATTDTGQQLLAYQIALLGETLWVLACRPLGDYLATSLRLVGQYTCNPLGCSCPQSGCNPLGCWANACCNPLGCPYMTCCNPLGCSVATLWVAAYDAEATLWVAVHFAYSNPLGCPYMHYMHLS